MKEELIKDLATFCIQRLTNVKQATQDDRLSEAFDDALAEALHLWRHGAQNPPNEEPAEKPKRAALTEPADPNLISNKELKASVGCHHMTARRLVKAGLLRAAGKGFFTRESFDQHHDEIVEFLLQQDRDSTRTGKGTPLIKRDPPTPIAPVPEGHVNG